MKSLEEIQSKKEKIRKTQATLAREIKVKSMSLNRLL